MDDKETLVIKNNREVEEILLSGEGLRICMCIYDKFKTVETIVNETYIPKLKIKLVLSRFASVKILETIENTNPSGIVEKLYKVIPIRIDVVSDSNKLDILNTINMFNEEMRRMFNNGGNASFIRLISIKAREKDAVKFISELEKLIEKYGELENTQSDETYSLITILGQG